MKRAKRIYDKQQMFLAKLVNFYTSFKQERKQTISAYLTY